MLTRRALVADHDLDHRLLLCGELERSEFTTATAHTMDDVLAALPSGMFDLVLLDTDLPGSDGASCCRKIRETSDVPLVVFGRPESKVVPAEVFAAGADDYLVKPLDFTLLLARVQAILRRARQAEPMSSVATMTRVQAGPLLVDHTAQRASFNGTDLNLSVKELQILFMLAQSAGKVVSRRQLQQSIWGADVAAESKTLDVHVSRLRKKLDEGQVGGDLIKTVRNRGYMLSSAIYE